jgi:hypothetical protein
MTPKQLLEQNRLKDLVQLRNDLTKAQNIRLNILKRREQDNAAQQQFSAKVVGFSDDGLILVSVNQGGAVKGRSLSNGNFAVGDIVSYFLAAGESVGFVDKMPSG